MTSRTYHSWRNRPLAGGPGEPHTARTPFDISENESVSNNRPNNFPAKRFVQNTPLGIHFYKLEENNRLVFQGANPAADAILGVDNLQFVGKTIEEAFPPLAETDIPERYREVARGGASWQTEQVEYKDDHIIGAFDVHAFQTAPNAMATMFHDITVNKILITELERSKKDWETIFHAIGQPALILDKDHTITDINEATTKATNKSRDEVVGRKCYELFHRTNHSPDECPMHQLLESQHTGTVEMTMEALEGTFLVACTPIVDDQGKLDKILHIATDITDTKRTERDLRESEQKYRLILDNSLEGIFLIQDERIIFCNRQFATMFKYSEEMEVMGLPLDTFITKDDLPTVLEQAQNLLKGDRPVIHTSFKCQDKEGKKFDVQALASGITFHGKPAIQGVLRDVSEQKRLEAQLMQAQKMESIGRLAGGVAHDFNNLLTAISGTAEIMQMSLSENDPFYNDLEQILKTSGRAAELTRQLLVFSRKQVIRPRVMDLNQAVENLDKMLRRLIGEDVLLVLNLGESIWNIEADPVQIEQILVNLAVNSRDAMPDGGRLSIHTENLVIDDDKARTILEGKPGEYVCLAVSDTGEGIPTGILEHIFEPFFTTKSKERGTGLGLSTVYGIVKQNGGMITCYSEVDNGTTFRIYLPRATRDTAQSVDEKTREVELDGCETILVVEDETMVRELAARTLRQFGYEVLEAGAGEDALLLFERADKVDLILTDVIMPTINGPELVDKIRETHPAIKVLYMSGYTEDVLEHRGMLDSEVDYISKPFRPKLLLERIRLLLDGGSQKETIYSHSHY